MSAKRPVAWRKSRAVLKAVLPASGVQTKHPGLCGLLASFNETCVCNLQVISCRKLLVHNRYFLCNLFFKIFTILYNIILL